ncbi:DUF1353 domain-containing protein (plasmid) [Mesorhizobium sp. AaZ16]|uniref:DUF1353 domain-containing protein n=1 Tax=Mesorhizobium sp. AaZ16 TaxID=3402289 RepID=UPI00374F1243
MRTYYPIGIVLAFALAPRPATADFVGQLELLPAGCEQQQLCTLSYDLKYIDPTGLAWQAAAQNQTDGASIPGWAQPFIGSPFDPSFIKAAVIHDHYCGRHVRSWRSTHRVFYDALRELGIPIPKAKLMYYAVYLAGPKWVELIPGRNCGDRCVFEVEVQANSSATPMEFDVSSEGGNATSLADETDDNPRDAMIISREASYDDPELLEELRRMEQIITSSGDQVDLEYLERRARDLRPGDFFYANESQIFIETPLSAR